MSKRPQTFVVTSSSSVPRSSHAAAINNNDDDDHESLGLPSRQDSLLPGQIHNPEMAPPTPFLDWTRGDSQLWEEKKPSPPREGANNGGGIWGSNDSIVGSSRLVASSSSVATRQKISSPTAEGDEKLLPQSLADVVSASSPHGDYDEDTDLGYRQQQHDQSYDDGIVMSREHSELFTNNNTSNGVVNNLMTSTSGLSSKPPHRSHSEILGEELHRQARLFPPPPPPSVPIESRRNRAALWYHHAAKWDITQRLPPPPRSPLQGMEEEFTFKLQELTRVPYRGDRWLARCEFWHDFVQSQLFDYPPSSQLCSAFPAIYENCVLE